jgi:CO/xanthine dehydrogenase FAD-binding subunit
LYHPGPLKLAPQELLTRIRVPLEPWTFNWYRKINKTGGNKPGGGILLILRNQKDILTDIRVVYSGNAILREKNSESMLAGKHLPLDHKDAQAFVDSWKDYLYSLEEDEKSLFQGEEGNFSPELIKAQIIHFIESTLVHISD